MVFDVFNSLRKLAHKVRQDKAARRRQAAHRGGSARLQLEQLEDRTLMSTFQWIGAGSDTLWTDSQNWALIPGTGTPANSYPNALGDIAQFTGSPSGNGTVSLNQAITVGEVDFGTATNITISSTNNSALTLDNTGFAPKALLTTLPANTGLDLVNVTLNAGTTPVAATLGAGTLQLNNSNAGANSFGSSSSFTVNGGALDIFAANNTGSANIAINNGGTVLVSLTGTLSSTATVAVNTGGALQVNDNAGFSTAGRFDTAANASLVLNGGTFSYLGASTNSSDTLPAIKLIGGSSTILTTTSAAGSVALTSPSLSRLPGATVTFLGSVAGSTTENLDTAANRIVFTTAPTTYGNNGGILPYAVVINNNFGGFATYDTANNSIGAFSGYVSSIALAGPGDTVLESSPEIVTGSKTINGLVLTGAGAVGLGSNTLTLATGGLLNTATGGGTITGGTLVFNPAGTGATGTGEGIVISGSVGGITANFYNLGFQPSANIPANVSATTASGPTQITYNMTPTSTRIDPSLNYPLATGLTGSGGAGPTPALPAGTQTANIAAQWTGSLNVVTAGSYTFGMTIADGAYLYIDGNLLFAAGANGSGPAAVSLPINLTAGLHTIRETFDHAVGNAANVIAWSGPDTGNNMVVLAAGSNPLQPGLVTSASTIISSIIGGSAASLTVAGPGTLTLPGANTLGGTTYLSGGILNVGNNTSLGTSTLSLGSGTLLASAAVTLANAFTLNDSLVTIGGVNNITLTGNGTLSDSGGGTNTVTVSNAGLTTISGALADGATKGSLTVAGGTQIANPFFGVAAGTGNLVLGSSSATSTFSGGTVLANGSLIVASNSAVGTGTLTLTSGTLLSGSSAIALTNPVVLNGNVTLAASSAGGTASTGSSLAFGGSVALTVNSVLTVNDAVAFNGVVSGLGQLTMVGLGSLTLGNAGNTYSGGTVLNAGSLGAAGTLIVANSNGTSGGVLTNGALGTGPLTLDNGVLQASASVTIANQLTLGSGYVTFAGANAINFSQASLTSAPTNSIVGTANLIANATNTTSPANTTIINDILTGSGNLVLLSGTDTLALTAADGFFGSTTVNGGNLSLSGANGSLTATSSITLNVGGVLTVDDTVTGANLANRMGDTGLQLDGGALNILGGSTSVVENLSTLSLIGGNSTVRLAAGSSSTVTLDVSFMARSNPGATVNFLAATGQKFGVADLVTFSSAPTLTPVNTGILPYATVTDATSFAGNTTGYNLATVNGSSNLVALTTYQTLSTSGGNASSDNVLVTATPGSPIASDTVNAVLVIGDGINLGGASGATLTVGSGQVASNDPVISNPVGNTISVPTLAFAAAEGLVSANAGPLAISSTITGTGGLTLGGAGNLVLQTPSNYSGGAANSQTVNITGGPTAGTFSLLYNGVSTGNLGLNPTATSIQTALAAIPSIGAGNVAVSGGSNSYFVTFGGALAGSVLPSLTVGVNTLSNGLTGASAPAVVIATSNPGESATTANGAMTFSGTAFSVGGTLTLTTNNAISQGLNLTGGILQATTTVTLPGSVVLGTNGGGSSAVTLGSSTAADDNSIIFTGGVILNGLTAAVAVANVPVSGSTPPIVFAGIVTSYPGLSGQPSSSTVLIKQGAGPLDLTASNTYTGETWIQQGILNAQNSTALGSSGNAVQSITFATTVTGGTFTLSFNGATTAPITWSSNGTMLGINIQYALNALSSIGLSNSVVTGTGPYTITFQNQLGATTVSALTASGANLVGTSPTVVAALTIAGSASGTVVASGATLQLQGGSTALTFAEAITLTGSGAGGLDALQNLIGSNILSNSVTLAGAATIGGNTGSLIVNGIITGAADLTKAGSGTVQLGGDNNYTGYTNLTAGVVQLNDATALGSNAGGTTVTSGTSLQLGIGAGTGVTSGTVTSRVGIIAGEALTISGAGLGLVNSTLLTANGALMANSNTPVAWTGNITFAADTTIATAVTTTVSSVNYPAVMTLSGNISGPGGLIKVGSSILYLTAPDTFTGATTVIVGTLTYAGSGSWQPATAPGTNAVQTLTFGGTVSGGSFTLSFNGATTTAIPYSSVATTLQASIQSALTALSSVGLSGNTNTLVNAASGTSVTVTFQNQLGDINVPTLKATSSLTGTSPALTVANTTVGVAAVNVRVGAAFTLDNTAANLSGRLSPTATISLNGGTFGYVGNGLGSAISTDTVGVITLGSGANNITVTNGSGVGATAILTSAALLRITGATVTFVGAATPLGTATSQLLFTSAITATANGPYANLTNGILPFATAQGPSSTSLTFATYASTGGVAAFTNYVTSLAAAQPTDNVILTTATTLSANVKVNSLLLLGTLTLAVGTGAGNFTLTVGSGGLVATSGGTATISGGTVDFGSAEGVITASTNITINSAVTGLNGLTASGAGTVTLNGTGTYTGTTTYNGGGINTGNLAIGIISALGNTPLTATAGVIGTSFGGNFSIFSTPITLNNSVVGFGLAGAQPTFAGPITLIGSDFISAPSNTSNMAGAIGGTGSLTIGPSGSNDALVLEGNNTYSGGTNLNPVVNGSSELDVASSNAFGSGPITWLGGQLNQIRVLAGPAVESASGAVNIPNQLNLINANVTVAGPYFKAQGLGNMTFSGNIVVTGTSAFNVVTSQNVTLSGVIQGSGGLAIGSEMYYGSAPPQTYVPSSVTLTNANTITGGVSFSPAVSGENGGVMIIENSAAFGTGIFTLADGTLQDDGVHTITIPNPVFLDAGVAPRTISATSPTIPFTFAGLVSATAGFAGSSGNVYSGLVKGGPGNVVFDSPIVLNNQVLVSQGTMTLAASATLTATLLTINPSATLVIDNTGSNNVNRVADNLPITLVGGTIAFKGNNAAGALSTETLDNITVSAGNSTISSTSGTGAGASALLTIANLTRSAGALLNFVGAGTNLGTATNQILVSGTITPTPTTVTGGFILPYASVTGAGGSLDFASVANNFGPYSIVPFTGYINELLANATNNLDVVKVTASDSVSGFSSPAAVLISGDNITIGGGGGSLNLTTGGLLVTGASAMGDTLSAAVNLTSATGEGLFAGNSNPTSGNAALNITGAIANTTNGGLDIGGTGSIELSAANTYGGTTTLGGGALVFDNNSALGATTSVLSVVGGTIQSGLSTGIIITNPVQLNTGITGFGAVTFSGANPLTLGGVVSGAGGIIVYPTTSPGATSSLTLSGASANTFDGDLRVNAGTLLLSKTANAMGPYISIYITGGTIQTTTSVNQFNSSDNANVTLSATNAVQTLTFSTSPAPTGGSFTLTFNGATTTPIQFSSVASTLQSNIQNALNVLSTVGTGNSVVPLPSGSTVLIVFQGALGGQAQNTITPTFTSLLPVGATVAAATTTVGAHGTLNLGASPASIDTMTFINGGTVTLTTGTLTFSTFNGSITTYVNPLFPGVAVSTSNPLSPSTAVISGGTVVIASFTSGATMPVNVANSNPGGAFSNPSQTLAFSGITGGNFTLSFNGLTTSNIAYSSVASTLASSIQTALNALLTVTAIGTTSVTGSGSNVTVTFLNTAPASVLPPITATFAPSVNAVQQLAFPTVTGGTFTLKYGSGAASSPINYTTNLATLQSSIQTVLNTIVGSGLTTVTALSATTVNVAFQGTLSAGVTVSALTGSGAAVGQQQTISFAGVTGGSFTLSFNNAPTTPIVYSSSTSTFASNIQTALTNLATIGSGNCTVSVTGTTATVTFTGTLAGVVQNTLTVNDTASATGAVQNIAFAGTPTGGTFTLTYSGTTSSAITYSTNLTTLQNNIQTALNTIVGSGLTAVTAVTDTSVNVTFQGASGAGVIQPSTVLSGNGVSVITNAVQSLTFPAAATGGTFTLTFKSATTGTINYSTSLVTLAANIQTALNGLSTIGTGNATVAPVSGTTVSVTFGGTLGGQAQALFTGNGVTVSAAYTVNFTGSPTGGNFQLSFNGVQTANIAYSTNPGTLQANIQNKLDALSTIGAGNTQAIVNTTATSATITFQNTLGGLPQPPITATGTNTTGGTISVTPSTTNGFAGLAGATTQTITAATTTAGVTTSLLTPIGTGAITGTTTSTGFGIVGSPTLTVTPTPNTAFPGLTGGTSTSITVATTQAGFGLTGSSPAINIYTSNPGFSGDLVIASAISGTVGMTKLGFGTLTFAGTAGNTFSGATNVNEGSLLLDKQAAVAAISGPLVIGIFSGTEVAKVVSNFTQLNGQNIYVTNSCTLDMTPAASTAVLGSTANQTIGSLDIRGGTVLTGTNTLVLGGDVTAVAIGTSPGTLTGKLDLGGNNRNFLVLDANTAAGTTFGLNLGAVISSASGTFGITKLGAGTLNLLSTAANTYTGSTTVNEGTLLLSGPVQTVAFTGSPTNGTFTLSVNGSTTQNITYSSTLATLESGVTTALNLLIGAGNFALGGTATALTITFQGALALGPSLTSAANTGLLGGTNPAVSIGGFVQVPGTLVVGDGVGGSSANKVDVVRLNANNEIASTAAVTVNNSGLLDLNSNNNTLAALTMSGGTVNTATGTLTLNGNVASTANAANITSATINGNLALGATQRTFDVQAGNLVNSLSVAIPDLVINAVISGSAGLAKVSDSGTVQLTAANTLTGPSTVTAGALLVDGSLAGGTLTVSGSGVLGGTGTSIPVVATSGGTINPGDPVSSKGILAATNIVGTATSTTATDLSVGGNLTIQIGGFTTAGTSYDQFNVTGLGILKLSNTSTLTLDLANLVVGASGNIAHSIITFSGLEGSQAFAPANILTINNPNLLVPVLTYNANSIDVTFAGPATHFGITETGAVTAGTPFTITVTALDQFGGTAASYTGTVHFSTTDPNNANAVLPGNAILTNGVGVFTGVKLITATVQGVTPSLQSITATDTVTSSLSGTLQVTVNPNTVSGFLVSAPTSAQAGQLIGFVVTARDQFGNTVPTFAGTVQFTSSDSQAIFSFAGTLTAGTGSFAAFLESVPVAPLPPTQTITATQVGNSSVTGTSNNITVNAGALNHLALTAPPSTAPGTPFTITVAAQDQFNNIVTNYTGTVHFTPVSGNGLVVPANYTFVTADNGVHVFTGGVTLVTAPSQTITATDTINLVNGHPVTGSVTVTVAPSTVARFNITTSTGTAAGFPFPLGVTAVDQYGNQVTSYAGTIHFTSSDGQASLPADSGLSSSGATFFGALLRTAGNDTITVTDQSLGISTTSSPIVVTNIAISQFALLAPANAVAGTAVPFTVTAQDQFKNTVPSYTGTVHFTSSDAAIAAGSGLPSNYTFTAADNGVHVFSVTFKTPGKQTLTATDTTTTTIVGTSSSSTTANVPTTVASLAVTGVTNDASSFTVNFNEPFVPADVNLYDLPVPSGPLGPTDVTLTGGGSGSTNGPVSFHGSLILNSTNTGFTFVKTSSFNGQSFAPVTGAFAAGTYTVTLRSAANGFHDSLGNLLSDINGSVGNNFVTTFVVTGAPAVVGIPSFARGPGNSVILPNNAVSSSNGSNQGIPINLSTITAAEAITSGSFTLVYNPALLTITGAAGVTLTGGQVVTLNAVVNTPGTAVITFTSSAALPNSTAAVGVRLGVLLANVPNGAAASYSSKAELSFTSESLNGGAVTITGDDAVEVVAYFGDVNGDGTLSGGDAALISQVANTSPLNGTLPGFTAFRLADPVILGDLNTNGAVDAPDVTLINSFLSGTTRTQIPTVNPNNLTITHLGPDPLLSVPTDLVASVGSTVVVPVDIDTAKPVGSTGMTEAILALEYNPKVFSVTPADVQLGSLPSASSGWQLQTVVNAQTGQIGIDLFSLTPIQTTSGGSLVTISLHVRDTAPVGSTGLSIANQVNPSGQRSFQTTVSDSQGALVLHTSSSGQWTIDNGQRIGEVAAVISGGTLPVDGNEGLSFSPTTNHQSPTSSAATEQVFADLAQVLLPESALVLLPEANWQQPIAANSDQALVQQLDGAENDWASADMVASLGQLAKAGGRSPSGNLVDSIESGQDGADLKGLEEFFAREATAGGPARDH